MANGPSRTTVHEHAARLQAAVAPIEQTFPLARALRAPPGDFPAAEPRDSRSLPREPPPAFRVRPPPRIRPRIPRPVRPARGFLHGSEPGARAGCPYPVSCAPADFVALSSPGPWLRRRPGSPWSPIRRAIFTLTTGRSRSPSGSRASWLWVVRLATYPRARYDNGDLAFAAKAGKEAPTGTGDCRLWNWRRPRTTEARGGVTGALSVRVH